MGKCGGTSLGLDSGGANYKYDYGTIYHATIHSYCYLHALLA